MKKTLSLLLTLMMILTAVTALPFEALAEIAITEDMVTLNRTVIRYDGNPQSPQVTVKDGNYVLVEGEDYRISYAVYEGPQEVAVPIEEQLGGGNPIEVKPDRMEIAPTDAGEYLVIIEGIEMYEGTVEKLFSIVEDDPALGAVCVDNSAVYYVNGRGVTSTIIQQTTEDANRIHWLREESDGAAAWYGFDGNDGALPEGSVVSVKWLSKDEDADNFAEAYNRLDNETKKNIEDGKLWVFELNAQTKDEQPIHQFEDGKQQTVYVQLGTDWENNAVNAIFVDNNGQEEVPAHLVEKYINGEKKQFAALTLNHFSTYIIYATAKVPAVSTQSIKGAKVTGIVKKTYNGKAQYQAPTVKLGGKTLVKGKDYKLSYKNNKAVGTATVTITGINAYTGTVKKTFKINPKGTALKKVTAGKKAFTAVWNKRTAQTTGYQIQYSTDKGFKKGNKTVTVTKNKTVKKTVKKLKANKKYYVRIRTYKKVGKVKYYSAWSKSIRVKTK